MPRKEISLSVFVASPSDVSEERDRLDAIIQEINSTHARRTGVRLDLLRWERDASPEIGKDAQAVINEQIPPCDIFIGILWHTIGSPTKRAESGTIEEFELAKKRYDENPNSVRIMLYFKTTAPLLLAEIDPDQHKRVANFKSRVREAGLYGEFATADDFANQVQRHLTKHVLDWQEGGDDGQATDELDEGILDLEEHGSRSKDRADRQRSIREVVQAATKAQVRVGLVDKFNDKLATVYDALFRQANAGRSSSYALCKKEVTDRRDELASIRELVEDALAQNLENAKGHVISEWALKIAGTQELLDATEEYLRTEIASTEANIRVSS